MKYKLLSVRTQKNQLNIGDYVQALASSQFLPSIDGFVNREKLKSYDGEPCKVIMNGWYMHDPSEWPPSDKINPLFVAFHINSLTGNQMLTDESISYLKKFEPIGCRDLSTVDLLKNRGIDAYFSGCMTLTLGQNYKNSEKEDKYYFCDPYFEYSIKPFDVIKNLGKAFINFKYTYKIAKKNPYYKQFWKRLAWAGAFYEVYSKLFSNDILTDAVYTCQQSKVYLDNFSDDIELLNEAQGLVKCYAKAKLVVTSRIHCALPCLGLGTPVLYTENIHQSNASACRLGGLRDLFTIIKVDHKQLIPDFDCRFITKNTEPFENKELWKPLAAALIDRCKLFVKDL